MIAFDGRYNMPVRLLREGILTSERVNQLTWPAEVFYRRLMSVVDDYGRYYASSTLLRASCYPLAIDTVSDKQIQDWLSECVSAGLLLVYEVAGKQYLEILDFRQQVRAKASKFPADPSTCKADAKQPLADAKQLPSNAHLDEDEDEDEDDTHSEKKPKGSKSTALANKPEDVSDDLWRSYQALRKAKNLPLTTAAFEGIEREAALAKLTIPQALQTCCENGWAGFRAEWLTNQKTKASSASQDPFANRGGV